METTREQRLGEDFKFGMKPDRILIVAADSKARKAFGKHKREVSLLLYASGFYLLYLPDVISSLSTEMYSYAFPGVNLEEDIAGRLFSEAFKTPSAFEGQDVLRFVRATETGYSFFVLDPDDIVGSTKRYIDILPPVNINSFKYSREINSLLKDSEDHTYSYPKEEEENTPKKESKRKTKSSVITWKKKVECVACDLDIDRESRPDVINKDGAVDSSYILSKDNISPTEADNTNIETTVEVSNPKNIRPTSKTSQEEELSEKTQAILKALKELNDRYGVTIEDIEETVSKQVELSKIRVTKFGRIILESYGNRELDLDSLSKALYILYLRHPEGISYKYLQDYRGELLDIYSPISCKGDLIEICTIIDHIVDPGNTKQVCTHVSRIKRAFIEIMNDRVARNYYIKGPQGGRKRVTLDRDKVIWE